MLRIRLLLVVSVVAIALLVVGLVASAGGSTKKHTSSTPFTAAGTFSAAGNPIADVNSYPDGAADLIHWSLCPPTGTAGCHPIASKDGAASPGPQPPRTVFKVTASYHGNAYSSSLTWRGRVHATSRPVLHGRVQFASIVTARAGSWTGGWGAESDQLGIEACPTTRGTRCVMLNGEQIQCSHGGPCGSLGGVVDALNRPGHARARVGNWYTGWYLFALDAHLANTISEAVGYGSPAAIPPWPLNTTVIRSKPYGPVTGPPAPYVHFLPIAQVRGDHVTVASVRCVVNCHVWVTVTRLRKHYRPGERVSWSANKVIKGIRTIGVWGPIPGGRVGVALSIGDGPNLHRQTRVP